MNKQELFEKAYNGVVDQGQLSKGLTFYDDPKFYDDNELLKEEALESSFYRYEGLKCSIGHLIPESLYNTSFEGVCIRRIIDLSKPLQEYLAVESYNDVPFLRDLQATHDLSSDLNDFKERMENLAMKYQLESVQ